jgi:uncharacterized protein
MKLPQFFEPWRMAQTRQQLTGEVDISGSERLKELSKQRHQRVHLAVAFYQDEQKRAILEGQVTCQLEAQCQRCLEAMTIDVDEQFRLALVHSNEQARRLPAHLEPLLLTAPHVAVLKLVEDEILLALPIVPKHRSADCRSPSRLTSKVQQPRHQPFQQLAALKTAINQSEDRNGGTKS